MGKQQRRKYGDAFHVSAVLAGAFRVMDKGSLGLRGHTRLALALILVVGLGIGVTAGKVLMPEALSADRGDALHHRWDGERRLEDGWAVLASTSAPLASLPSPAEAVGIDVVGDGQRSEQIICTDDWDCFFLGYRGAGGQHPEGQIDAMVQCESSWRLDPDGYHLGLAQFSPGTWVTVSAITGLADPYNPYHQGYNVAVWASMVSPGTTAGWPYCWWAW